MVHEGDPLWLHRPSILFSDEQWLQFWPWGEGMSDNEVVNALSRLVMYSSILMCLFDMSFKPFLFAMAVLIIGVLVFCVMQRRDDKFSQEEANKTDVKNKKKAEEEYEQEDAAAPEPINSEPMDGDVPDLYNNGVAPNPFYLHARPGAALNMFDDDETADKRVDFIPSHPSTHMPTIRNGTSSGYSYSKTQQEPESLFGVWDE
jgi:hypothetical protein